MGFYVTLEKIMRERGITAAELSRKTGLYQSTFTEMKKGRAKSPKWETALLIIDALGMTPDEFAERQRQEECK